MACNRHSHYTAFGASALTRLRGNAFKPVPGPSTAALRLSNTVLNADPTRTTLIRQRWAAEMTARFKKIKRHIWRAIVIDDVFGLKPKPSTIKELIGFEANAPQQEFLLPRQFAFKTLDEKVNGFMGFLRERMSAEVLEIQEWDGPAVVRHGAWQNTYIDSAYKKGLGRAESELAKAGITVPPAPDFAKRAIDSAFLTPIHADRVGLLYTRAFTELKGITDALDQQISRSLAESIAEGRGPRQMARILLNRIEKTGGELGFTDSAGRNVRALTRARTLARTETIRAHHAATINTYRSAGVEGVRVKAEWSTAGDDRVCDECEALEGRVFTLDEIEGLIPRHPNCRCVALPAVVESEDGGEVVDQMGEDEKLTWAQKIDAAKTEDDLTTILKEAKVLQDDRWASFRVGEFKKFNDVKVAVRQIVEEHQKMLERFPGIAELNQAKPIRSLTLGGKRDFKTSKFGADSGGIRGTWSGLYKREYDSIYVSRGNKPWGKRHSGIGIGDTNIDFNGAGIWRHEFGHHVDAYKSQLANRKEASASGLYKRFLEALRGIVNEKGKSSISYYARTDTGEAFAEAFSAYTHPSYGMPGVKRLPKTIEETFDFLLKKMPLPGAEV